MKLAVRYFSVLAFLVFANFAFAQANFDKKDLPNFHEVGANIFRGGQPTENGVRELARRGVKTIIDLRGEDEHAQIEGKWARAAGIKFINVSLSNWFKPQTAQVDEILADIENAENQPIFVHCRRGADRTGTVIAAYRISHDNYTAEQAISEAKGYGLGWWQLWMKNFIVNYYHDRQKGK